MCMGKGLERLLSLILDENVQGEWDTNAADISLRDVMIGEN